ncbi:MAG: 50S ribosomal protein L25 [Candidatus Omnitrophica bacterium]|nr:50S ribosomal protein L25 [Candidatus Omnitrophota bacterium]
MEEIILEAEARTELKKSKVKELRNLGYIPAVLYGDKKESLPLKVSHEALLKLIHQHRIEGVVINLRIKDGKKAKDHSCLIKEIQYDPVHGDVIHVDFNEISLTKVIKINVPVIAKGDAIGVKLEGGSLEHILWEVEVECLPTNIPKNIEVDVSQLKIGEAIHIKDIVFPEGVKVLHEPETIVLSVAAPMKEEVVAPSAEGEAPQEPEVIKEKKEAPESVAEGKSEEGKKEK